MITAQPINQLQAYAKAMELLPNVIFFVKDEACRYRLANQTMANLCGVSNPDELLGRSTAEFFERSYVAWCNELDRDVLSGSSYERRLDCVTDTRGEQHWTLYSRVPVLVNNGSRAIVSVSQIMTRGANEDRYRRLRLLTEEMFDDLADRWTHARMAERVQATETVVETDFQVVFGCTPKDYLDQARVNFAIELILRGEPLVDVAAKLGFSEQSALSRFIKRMTGRSPRQFRVAQN
ncbi:MAG: helix-turn-helix domain-containing protein [Pseudomonadota bacterium]